MNEIIERFKNLDLEKASEKDVLNIFDKLRFLPAPITDYHEGKIIHRARRISKGQTVNLNSELSYTPEQFNNSFQRASTPRQTMFYGAVIPEIRGEIEVPNERIIGACEISDFLRNIDSPDGEETIVFGKWRVKETISLLSIIDPATELNKIAFFKEMTEGYHKFLEHINDEKNNAILFQEFISSEFSKPKINSERDYLISALLTERVINQCDGVIYPSVRADYKGLCVSIKPETVDEKMELIEVLECSVIKKNGAVKITNLRYAEVNPEESEFELKEINAI